MHSIQLSVLKSNINKVIKQLELDQEELVIEYGKQHKKVAVIVPYNKYSKNYNKIKFGCLQDKADIKISDNFEISENEFINL